MVKDLFKLRLLLNDVSVFHENPFEIWCGLIVLCWIVLGGNKRQNLSVCLFCFVAKSLFSAGELNFSQYFVNERQKVASLTEAVFKASFPFFKVFSELVLKRRVASPFIKPFLEFKGW